MSRAARLFSFVALTCSGPALLAPVCRWALRAMQVAAAVPVRFRARGRPAARNGRSIDGARRSGPRSDRRAARRAARRESSPLLREL